MLNAKAHNIMTMPTTHSLKPSILMVDDDPDIGIALGDWLHQEGYFVHIVQYGQAGIDALKWHTYHTVILDLGLPDMDGIDVLKRMKEWDSHLPIIILTAFSCFERPAMTSDSQSAFAYLKKPYNRLEIKSTLDRALHQATQFHSGLQVVPRPALS